MKLYFAVVKFNWLKILAYPFEIIAFFASRFFALGFLALFWYALANSSGGSMDFRPLVAYFFVTAAIRELTFGNDSRFGRFIQQLVIRGDINNYFIKPIKTVPFLFFSFAGETWMGQAYAVVTLILGLIILPPLSLLNIFAFIVFLFLALIISICFNVLIGTISFYSPEAGGFRNAFNHINKILSGSLMPLNLFPDSVRGILMLLPFPALIFTPAYVLQNKLSSTELLGLFATTFVWSIILIFITNYLWRLSIKNYEGVGI
jgi:ABC-2 type transport system permease protein